MKPTLERTSITCKDIGEQPQRRFILILPEQNVAVRCDDVQVYDGAITGTEEGSKDPLISANNKVEWIVLRDDVAELSTRAAALRRTVENQVAEQKHVKDLVAELAPDVDVSTGVTAPANLPGYL